MMIRACGIVISFLKLIVYVQEEKAKRLLSVRHEVQASPVLVWL
jgi:hypothetical protein